MKTNNNQSNFAPRLTPIAAFILASFVSSGYAQEQSSDSENEIVLEELTVTGSRIKRRDLVAQSPIATTQAEAIIESGFATADEYLRQLPQFQPGAGAFSNSSSGGTVGQANLNLRGLGTQRNLVLMDGRRLQSSSIRGEIDINTIPLLAVGDIEVISGGASATYGSDAISGVVNFKARRDLEGFEAMAQRSQADEGDGGLTQFGFALGSNFDGNQGYFMISGEHVDRRPIARLDRSFYDDVRPSSRIPNAQYTPVGSNLADEAVVDAIFAGYGFDATAASNRTRLAYNDDGTLFVSAGATGLGANYRGSTEAPYIEDNGGRSGYHGSYYNFVRVPLERSSLFATGEYEFDSGVRGYMRAMFARSEAQNTGSEPISASGSPVFVPVTNPFIPDDLATMLASRPDPTADFQVFNRLAQFGPRTYVTETDLFQISIGANGTFEPIDMNWDIYFSRGETENTDRTIAGSVSRSALETLGTAPDGGASICAGGWNPFAGAIQMGAECIEYAQRTPSNTAEIEQDVIEFIGEGPMFEVPAGEARYAINLAYRKDSYSFIPDADVAARDLVAISSAQVTQGETDVVEAGLEVFVPLLSDLPGVDSLNLSAAFRVSEYNLAGTADTYKIGLDWSPVENVLLRGAFQHALRAPNIGEYFLAGNSTIQGIGLPPDAGDPCDINSSQRSGANAANVRELCVATGLSEALVDDYESPTGSLVTQTIGNPNLEPETADTFTFGAVIQSPFEHDLLKDMTLTVDYYDIEIEGAIATLNALDVLNKCYNVDGSNPSYDANNFFCSQLDRTQAGGFNELLRPNLNLGGFKTSGVDISFDWSLPLAELGTLDITSYANVLDNYSVQTLEGGPFVDWAGTVSGGDSFPDLVAVSTFSFRTGPLSIGVRWSHTSAMDDSSLRTNPNSETEGTDTYDTYDLIGSFTFKENYTLRFGINNLEDRSPEVVGGRAATTNPGVFDDVGRRFFLGLKASF